MSELLHHLDVFLCEEVVGRVGALSYGIGDLLYCDGLCLCLAYACCGLSLGAQYCLLLVCLGAVDGRGLLSLRLQYGSLFLSLAGEDGGTLVTLCLHLLLHGVEHALGRCDVLQLDAVHLDTPFVCGIVEHGAQLGVYGVA